MVPQPIQKLTITFLLIGKENGKIVWRPEDQDLEYLKSGEFTYEEALEVYDNLLQSGHKRMLIIRTFP